MIEVVCINVGEKFGVEYPSRLQQGVQKWLKAPHRFTVFTDKHRMQEHMDYGMAVRPPPMGYSDGWWTKVALFGADVFNRGSTVLYLDLDVVLCGSLDTPGLLANDDKLHLVRGYRNSSAMCGHNSSVMGWVAGDHSQIWERFSPTMIALSPSGDQWWITREAGKNLETYPEEWFPSYKYEIAPKGGVIGPLAVGVVFHGLRKPHTCQDSPVVQDHWLVHKVRRDTSHGLGVLQHGAP